jgi:hypothetical protein
MKTFIPLIFLFLFLNNPTEAQTIDPTEWPGMVGYWDFDDPLNLTHAEVGNDLVLGGSDQAVPGPEPEDGATRIGVNDYYTCTHGIEPNGGGSYVNEYTLVVDFKIPQVGQYYCFYQTNMANSNDGEVFINPSGHVGITETGYSYCTLTPNEWYRLVISVDLGNSFNYYIDGQLILAGYNQIIDGRYSLESYFHWFLDDNGEDNEFDVAAAAIFDYPISETEVAQLGGYGHIFPQPPVDWMNPYLQTMTTSSVYVCWHSDIISSSIVEYGTDLSLDLQTTGTYEDISGKKWHTVQLTGLDANTEYFYHCISGTDTSVISSFRTKKEPGTSNSHVRFVLVGDTRTDSYMVQSISETIEGQLTNDYGEDWQNEVDMVINVGDIVTTGSVIDQYTNEYFLPYSNLTDKIPFYVSIGNHEIESPNYYNYMKYEEMTGDPYNPPNIFNEKFYAFRYGSCQFIALNSNIPYQLSLQTEWLENILDSCETDPAIDFIVTFCHHPGHSEIWPDGNTNYVQNDIIPLLQNYSKTAMLFYGHSHDYEHGTVELNATNAQYNNDMHIVLSGGGGSPLDRWGMYGNQQDYPEIFYSLDHYDYSIIDIDVDDKSYTARTFSLGHTDKVLDNEIVDFWYSKLNQSGPDMPQALDAWFESNNLVVLEASGFSGVDSLMSSQFQITETPGDYSNPLVDVMRNKMNIYGDSGAPDYFPVDLNEGIDLTTLSATEEFSTNVNYGWRVRYRDFNLKWSEWSEEFLFNLTDIAENTSQDNSLRIAPNPFNRKMTINFTIDETDIVSLKIHNSQNKEIDAILTNEKLKPGNYSYTWNPEKSNVQLQSGIYFCRLVSGKQNLAATVIYVRK